jgi:hypothetical protein
VNDALRAPNPPGHDEMQGATPDAGSVDELAMLGISISSSPAASTDTSTDNIRGKGGKLAIHSAHESTLLALLSAMGTSEYPKEMLGFGSMLILQTFQEDSTGKRFMQVRRISALCCARSCLCLHAPSVALKFSLFVPCSGCCADKRKPGPFHRLGDGHAAGFLGRQAPFVRDHPQPGVAAGAGHGIFLSAHGMAGQLGAWQAVVCGDAKTKHVILRRAGPGSGRSPAPLAGAMFFRLLTPPWSYKIAVLKQAKLKLKTEASDS